LWGGGAQALVLGKDKFNGLMREFDLKPIFLVFTDGPVCPGGEGKEQFAVLIAFAFAYEWVRE
jgi:hypothetical protein